MINSIKNFFYNKQQVKTFNQAVDLAQTDVIIGKTKPLKLNFTNRPIFTDSRGLIFNLSDDKQFSSVLYIASKPNSIRANHYHKEDYHLCVLTKGEVVYFERPVGSQKPPTKKVIGVFEPFFTAPMMEHAMLFTEYSDMWCFSKLNRQQDNYESDTVRFDFDLTKI